MKVNRLVSAAVVTFLFPLFAQGGETEGRGPWTFSAGPAWRARVKMDISGTGRVPQLSPDRSESYGSFNPGNQSTWNGHSIHAPVAVPEKYGPYPGQQTWAIDATRTVTEVTPGTEGRIDGSDEDNALGLDLAGGYDFYQDENFSVGAGLRFAGYWNLRSSAGGYSCAGTVRTREYTDMFLFMSGIDAGDPAPVAGGVYLPEGTADYRGASPVSDRTEIVGGRAFGARIRSDLYQLGFGPKLTWHACGRLDVYGGAEVLLNLARTEFDADGASSSRTDCLLGFGGYVGLVGRITDWCGVYGQVGYEWVDETDVRAGDFRSDIDYSSLVLSAGLSFRF